MGQANIKSQAGDEFQNSEHAGVTGQKSERCQGPEYAVLVDQSRILYVATRTKGSSWRVLSK